jgi:hypothetical protein
MKLICFVVFAVAICVVPFVSGASGESDSESAPIFGVKLPAGYRDWALISVARIGAPFNDIRAKLGNDVAVKAYRAGTLPFPDGAIIVRLAWKETISEENNRALSPLLEKQGESVVAGDATNVQLMVKDSKKYAATGGWGFAQFDNGKPANEAVHKTCFSCHTPVKDMDFVFTRYSR